MGSTTGGSRINEASLVQLLMAVNNIAPSLVELSKNKDAVIAAAKQAFAISEAEQAKAEALRKEIADNEERLADLKDHIVYVNNATADLGGREEKLKKDRLALEVQAASLEHDKTYLDESVKSHSLNAKALKEEQERVLSDSIQLEMDKTAFNKEKKAFEEYAARVKDTAKKLSGFTSKLDI